MFSIDDRQVKQLSRALDEMPVKFAQRNTINDLAFATQRNAREEINRKFIVRNAWTGRSVQVDRARTLGDSAEVGSVQQYMADQEFGAEHTRTTSIAKPASSGESNRAKVRRKVQRKANRMTSIRLKRQRVAGATRAQRNAAAVRQAKAEGEKFVYLDRGPTSKGIYRVFGTKRKPKTRMVQDLSRKTHVVPRNPWLLPASERAHGLTPELYARQLKRQLRRIRALA